MIKINLKADFKKLFFTLMLFLLLLIVIVLQISQGRLSFRYNQQKEDFNKMANYFSILASMEKTYIGKNISTISNIFSPINRNKMPNKYLLIIIPYESCAPCVEQTLEHIKPFNKSRIFFLFQNYPHKMVLPAISAYSLGDNVLEDSSDSFNLVYKNSSIRKNFYVLTIVDKIIVNAVYFSNTDNQKLDRLYQSIMIY